MKISIEIITKVFAQYLGCDFQLKRKSGELVNITLSALNISEIQEDDMLILKNLSDITDEDAIKVINMLNNDVDEKDVINGLKNKHIISEMFKHDTEYISSPMYTIFAISMVQQYLQSQGYDVPNYYLDGKTCIEAGIAVYIKTLK